MRPEIVCLCGSTRFWSEYQRVFRELSLEGKIVLTVAFATFGPEAPNGFAEVAAEQKAILDELHLRKIDAADVVYVINVDGYIGESTTAEIEYAEARGKPVYYHETPCAEGAPPPQSEHTVSNLGCTCTTTAGPRSCPVHYPARAIPRLTESSPQQGWVCPKCGNVYAPAWIECLNCNRKPRPSTSTQTEGES